MGGRSGGGSRYIFLFLGGEEGGGAEKPVRGTHLCFVAVRRSQRATMCPETRVQLVERELLFCLCEHFLVVSPIKGFV